MQIGRMNLLMRLSVSAGNWLALSEIVLFV